MRVVIFAFLKNHVKFFLSRFADSLKQFESRLDNDDVVLSDQLLQDVEAKQRRQRGHVKSGSFTVGDKLADGEV